MSLYSVWPERAAQVAPCLAQHAAKIDREGAFPTAEFDWLRDSGLLSAPIPPSFGGAGLGTVPDSTAALLKVLWHIGYGNLAVGRLYEGHVNALQLIAWHGDETQKERWFAEAKAGKIFAVWNTQAQSGVTLHETQSGIEIRGNKTFCSGAGHVERPIVTGELEGRGWQMAVVPMDEITTQIDKSWWQPLGMRASASFGVDFSGATFSSQNLLGQTGDYYAQPAFSGGAIRFCAVQLGGVAALFDETRRFLRQTERTDDPFQRMRAGQMATHVESGLMWLERAGNLWDSDPGPRTMVAFAAMMRVATEEIGLAVIEMAQKSVGARGLLRPEPFERIIRDLVIYLKQPHLDEIPCRIGEFVLSNPNNCDELFSP